MFSSKLKILCAAGLATIQFLSGQLSASVGPALLFENAGWNKSGNDWVYTDENGVLATGWAQIGSRWYYFDSDGIMQTGWLEEGGKWYYLTASGAMATGWKEAGNKWYYFNKSGVMQKGWLQDGGKWYYLGPSGDMKTGWQQIGGKWYFLKSNGAMATGWLQDGGKWYYLDASGAMKTGFLTEGDVTYYLNPNGSMATGWKDIGGEWYYFKPGSGEGAEGWYKVGGSYYYFEGSEMQHDKYIGHLYLESSGRIYGNIDPTDPENVGDASPIFIGSYNLDGRMSDCVYTQYHVLGYPDPTGDFDYNNLVTSSVSGWTYIGICEDFQTGSTTFVKAEDFDFEAFKAGKTDYAEVSFYVLPGQKAKVKVVPSEEYSEFLGWSFSQSYDPSKIFSKELEVSIRIMPDTKVFAHVNSPWDSCYTDEFYGNTCTKSPQTSGIIYRLPCHRDSNGRWILDKESMKIIDGVAFYHYDSYSSHRYPSPYNPHYYDFFNKSGDYEFTTDKMHVELQIDDYGEPETDGYYTLEYTPDGYYCIIMYDRNGNIRPLVSPSRLEMNEFFYEDPVTGEFSYFYDERRAARYNVA